MMIKALIIGIGVVSILAGGGCSGNPTNEPTAADVAKANQDRAAAIDKDPNMTDAQKAEMKSHLGLGPKGKSPDVK